MPVHPQTVEMTLAQFRALRPCRIPADYKVDQVSWKVAKIILSYTDYVNHRTWLQNNQGGSPSLLPATFSGQTV